MKRKGLQNNTVNEQENELRDRQIEIEDRWGGRIGIRQLTLC